MNASGSNFRRRWLRAISWCLSEQIPWYTITDSVDKDFSIDEYHGHNVFIHDGERVFRTYFRNWRGDEAMGTIWSYLDITPLAR